MLAERPKLEAAFKLHAPHIARWLFGVAALLSLTVTGSFDDMAFWGLALSVPCVLSALAAKRTPAVQRGGGSTR
ncbi:MAG: hypothetical protein EXR52_07470 [Dehalococcoidia bacterium]|nr:hypothetical protein [Dehalococcoidia bacterium]